MTLSLQAFGWSPFFMAQITQEDLESRRIGRVIEVQRTVMTIYDGESEHVLPLSAQLRERDAEDRPTVGDWIVLSNDRLQIERVLERFSVFRRVAAGSKAAFQLIAANVDTVFVVTSCNDDFNESRLERYLAIAAEAGVKPVVVLSKIDLTESVDEFIERARRVQRDLAIETVNALDETSFDGVRGWIQSGTTVALVGSSGVGKSTLLNTLSGRSLSATGGIRTADQKGRHTTSYRALFPLPHGGLLIDVPGMRELKVADVHAAITEIFDDIEALAKKCRYGDCQHEAEPGCSVQNAILQGEIDSRRLQNYQKLLRENKRHSATLAESRSSDKAMAKVIRNAKTSKQRKKTQN